MRMKRLFSWTAVLLFILVASCDSKSDAPTIQGNIAVLLKSDQHFGRQIVKGVSGACARLNYVFDVFYLDNDADYESQIAMMQGLSKQTYDGVILIPTTPDNTAVQEAVTALAAKLPVALVDAALGTAVPYVSYIGSSETAMGGEMARYLRAHETGLTSVGVICLQTDAQAVACQTVFVQDMAQAGVVATVEYVQNAQEVPAAVQRLLDAAHTCLFFCDGSTTIPALTMLAQMPQIKLYGVDAPETVVAAIEAGKMQAVWLQDTYGYGSQAVMTLHNYLDGYTLPRVQYMEGFILNKANRYSADALYYLNAL